MISADFCMIFVQLCHSGCWFTGCQEKRDVAPSDALGSERMIFMLGRAWRKMFSGNSWSDTRHLLPTNHILDECSKLKAPRCQHLADAGRVRGSHVSNKFVGMKSQILGVNL